LRPEVLALKTALQEYTDSETVAPVQWKDESGGYGYPPLRSRVQHLMLCPIRSRAAKHFANGIGSHAFGQIETRAEFARFGQQRFVIDSRVKHHGDRRMRIVSQPFKDADATGIRHEQVEEKEHWK
jgi:hypothetical protein